MTRDLATLLRAAQGWLDETDALALDLTDGRLAVETKADMTLVTQVDTRIERFLRDRIADVFPRHVVAGEEEGMDDDAGDGRWIVDPIDATHNLVRGVDVWATLLAFERDGELELGLVSAPALGRRWFATRGGGAFLRSGRGERRIGVSSVASIGEAQVLFSTLQGMEEAGLGDALRRLTAAAWRDRGFGDFWAHMLVAQGSAEAMLEYGVKPWDMAAPYVVVTEAGGRMTDFSGAPSWTSPRVLTSNGVLHDALLELIGAW
jgi:histidinol-phosphatase